MGRFLTGCVQCDIKHLFLILVDHCCHIETVGQFQVYLKCRERQFIGKFHRHEYRATLFQFNIVDCHGVLSLQGTECHCKSYNHRKHSFHNSPYFTITLLPFTTYTPLGKIMVLFPASTVA